MKRTIFITVLIFVCSFSSYAQFEIDSIGGIRMAHENCTSNIAVGIGTYPSEANIINKASVYSYLDASNENRECSSIIGEIKGLGLENSSRAGVLGVAKDFSLGKSYGVWGRLETTPGAAVYGTMGVPQISIAGYYAGCFVGPVVTYGAITTPGVNISSDINLKDNITPFDAEEGSATSRIMEMNVVKYNYKNTYIDELLESDNKLEESTKSYLESEKERMHFGLIAQELQTIYPNLVTKGQDGYLSINYTELIPVLLKSIQELKQEIDYMQKGESKSKSLRTTDVKEPLDYESNKLIQNIPNPFKESTTIPFSLAHDAKDAKIVIFDMQGKMIKKYAVTPDMKSIEIHSSEIGEGMFIYTLIVNGKEIDTKRMINTY